MNSPHQRPGKFGGHPSIAFKKAGEGYEQSKRALGGRVDMRLRYSESLTGLEEPLHWTAYADSLLCSVRSVQKNATHKTGGAVNVQLAIPL